MSQGLEKVIRMCTEESNPVLVATVAHGVLEPCSMVVLKGLRSFVKDESFHQFTHKVMKDEAHHIRLVPSDETLYPDAAGMDKNLIKKAAITAFRAMASVGKGKLLIKTLQEDGCNMEDERPYESFMYLKKNEMTVKVVGNQLSKMGIDIHQ